MTASGAPVRIPTTRPCLGGCGRRDHYVLPRFSGEGDHGRYCDACWLVRCKELASYVHDWTR